IDYNRALAESDDRTLDVLALAGAEPGPPGLAGAVHGVHGVDLDVEDLLDGDLDLGLVGPRVDDERVLAVVEEPVGLLGDDRTDQDVARFCQLRCGAHLPSSSVVFARPARKASRAAWVKTMSSAQSTS